MFLILGFGYVAQELVQFLPQNIQFVVTSRDGNTKCNLPNVKIIDFNAGEIKKYLAGAEYILDSTPPTYHGISPVISLFGDDLVKYLSCVKWIGYFSSTAVYGNSDGAYVDEKSSLLPTSLRGIARVRVENDWQEILSKFKKEQGVGLNIFRLSGIYGKGRSVIERIKAGDVSNIYKKGHYFSRIHVDDIVNIVAQALKRSLPGVEIYNLADDLPASSSEVLEYGFKLLGMPPLPREDFNEAKISEGMKSFYYDNKKVSNDKIKQKLGVALKYPTYKEGLQAIIMKK